MKQSVLDDPSLDPFTRHVLSKIDPDVFASLTEHQFAAFRHALDQARPIHKHAVDIRGVIPLLVARFYFVLLAGRDRRTGARAKERQLRYWLSSALGTLVLGSALLLPILAVLLVVGYALKTFLGIDLDPTHHARDFLM